jgi:hypothetical protein
MPYAKTPDGREHHWEETVPSPPPETAPPSTLDRIAEVSPMADLERIRAAYEARLAKVEHTFQCRELQLQEPHAKHGCTCDYAERVKQATVEGIRDYGAALRAFPYMSPPPPVVDDGEWILVKIAHLEACGRAALATLRGEEK